MFTVPIAFENESLVVVDKPVGISIHNTEDPINLIEILERQFASSGKSSAKFYPVHRLDKETSGLQIFARDEASARHFAESFQTRSVQKIYRAVMRGTLKQDEGVWNFPISDKSEGRTNPAGVTQDRVAAETHFRVTRRSKYLTECTLDLKTGRQHQIRKHAALAGHSLVGDPRYSDKKHNMRMAEIYGETRMFLHCERLELEGFKFEAPVPESFSRLFDY